jgi:hypothetical protein
MEFSLLHWTQYAHHVEQFMQYTVTVDETCVNHVTPESYKSIYDMEKSLFSPRKEIKMAS